MNFLIERGQYAEQPGDLTAQSWSGDHGQHLDRRQRVKHVALGAEVPFRQAPSPY